MALPVPTLRLGGTHADDLLTEFQGAINAAQALIKAMPRPHGRDYLSHAEYLAAREAYQALTQTVASISRELEEAGTKVADAQAEHRARALRGVGGVR
jgi:hypothetical protein